MIRGIGSSSDGRSKSIYAPRAEGQRVALRRAYADADVSPGSVELFEAHATGTTVGDRTELTALGDLLREACDERHFAALGSVKSQIGHTKGAAGTASLMKLALRPAPQGAAAHHQRRRAQPRCRLADAPFYINVSAPVGPGPAPAGPPGRRLRDGLRRHQLPLRAGGAQDGTGRAAGTAPECARRTCGTPRTPRPWSNCCGRRAGLDDGGHPAPGTPGSASSAARRGAAENLRRLAVRRSPRTGRRGVDAPAGRALPPPRRRRPARRRTVRRSGQPVRRHGPDAALNNPVGRRRLRRGGRVLLRSGDPARQAGLPAARSSTRSCARSRKRRCAARNTRSPRSARCRSASSATSANWACPARRTRATASAN